MPRPALRSQARSDPQENGSQGGIGEHQDNHKQGGIDEKEAPPGRGAGSHDGSATPALRNRAGPRRKSDPRHRGEAGIPSGKKYRRRDQRTPRVQKPEKRSPAPRPQAHGAPQGDGSRGDSGSHRGDSGQGGISERSAHPGRDIGSQSRASTLGRRPERCGGSPDTGGGRGECCRGARASRLPGPQGRCCGRRGRRCSDESEGVCLRFLLELHWLHAVAEDQGARAQRARACRLPGLGR